MKRFLPISILLLMYFLVALYRLDTLPGEWFGDISNLHEYVVDIQKGKWPLSYKQSVGPLYHYAITPLTVLTGQRYIGYKTLSVLSGALSLVAIFLLSRSLTDQPTALLTTGITAVSFWFLVWARLGNLHAVLPGVSALTVYLVRKWDLTKKSHFLFLGAVVASCGLYIYLGTILLPVVFLILIGILAYRRRLPITYHAFAPLIFIFVLAGVLFAFVIASDTHEFFSPEGYIGGKIFNAKSTTVPMFLTSMAENIIKTAGMLHIRGDEVFRINIPNRPMLDPVSGVMFIVGLIGLIRPIWKGKRIFIFVPIMILVLPSVSPTLLSREIPSATRMFAAVPFIFLLVGMGISQLGRLGKLGRLGMMGVIGVIGILNMYRYFVDYPKTLPDHNVAYGAIIARYIDNLPKTTTVYLADCCWGSWGQPEPKGIYYQLRHRQGREGILAITEDVSCNELIPAGNHVIILSPKSKEKITQLQQCSSLIGITHHPGPDGNDIFVTIEETEVSGEREK